MCSDSYPVVATSNDSYPFPRATDKSTEGWGGSGGVGGYHQHQTVSNGIRREGAHKGRGQHTSRR